MKRIIAISIILSTLLSCNQNPSEHKTTKEDNNNVAWVSLLQHRLTEYGHRNWIVVVDAAYPKQSNPSIETVHVDASQLEVIEKLAGLIEKSPHVKANILIDKEMAYVDDSLAIGIKEYRKKLAEILESNILEHRLHEDIIKQLDNTAELFNVLILKTDLTIPYTSVFFQLECGYWDAESEKKMRSKIE